MPRDYISRKQTQGWRENYDRVYPAESLGLTRERWLSEGLPEESFPEWKARMLKRRSTYDERSVLSDPAWR